MPQKTSDLTTKLPELRRLVRMSQKDLADSTRAVGESEGVSLATVQSIEAGTTTPKPVTLQRLAAGLVRDPFSGAVDQGRSADVYRQLLVAAGHIEDQPPPTTEPQPRRPVEDLTDDEVAAELERRMGDREVAMSFLAAANNWRGLSPRSQRLILETVRYATGEDDDPPAARRPGR